MSSSLDVQRVKQLVAAHCPILHLHHEEQFLPCSAEFFLEHSDLMLVNPAADTQVVMLCSLYWHFVADLLRRPCTSNACMLRRWSCCLLLLVLQQKTH